jgi:3-oxosteroid 1-dehydrogenase
MTDWDKSVDLLIVGSGGGGMVAALATLDAGLEPLVVEKQTLVGGSTGLSGGMVWLPNNPLMRRAGVADSHGTAPTLPTRAATWAACRPRSALTGPR